MLLLTKNPSELENGMAKITLKIITESYKYLYPEDDDNENKINEKLNESLTILRESNLKILNDEENKLVVEASSSLHFTAVLDKEILDIIELLMNVYTKKTHGSSFPYNPRDSSKYCNQVKKISIMKGAYKKMVLLTAITNLDNG
jgi:hypothetical protein